MALGLLAVCLVLTTAKRHAKVTSMLAYEEAASDRCSNDGVTLRLVLPKLGMMSELRGDYCTWPGVHCVDSCVERIQLMRRNLSGALPVELAQLSSLKFLYLSDNPRLSGSLSTLMPLVHLQALVLDSTGITGGLEALQGLKHLTHLGLANTGIDGSLEAVQDMKNITRLQLSTTKITGRLEDLRRLRDMEALQLSKTQVAGHLEALQGIEKIWVLALAGTRINGDLQNLLDFPDLEEVRLQSTRVTGRLTPQWRGRLPYLRILNLADTWVNFLPTAADLDTIDATYFDPEQAILPQLQQLDVSGCPLDCPVKDLLWLLRGSAHVGKMYAARSNLTGYVPDLIGNELAESLLTLDLSQNRIRRVDGLLAGSLLALAYNPNITFADGVIHKAIQTGVRVDLRGIELNRTDAPGALELLPSEKNTAAKTLVYRGFVCYDLGATVLQVTPELFLRDEFCHSQKEYAHLNKSYLPAFKCLYPAEERCGITGSSELGCSEGYDGILCSMCAEKYRSKAGSCMRCSDDSERAKPWIAGAALLMALVGAGAFAVWRIRANAVPPVATTASSPTAWDALVPLLLEQGPVLLQLLQLWGVLTALASPMAGADKVDKQMDQEFAQWVELTATSIRDALSLECAYGRKAWIFSAFASPGMPLLLLLLCAFVEVIRPSRGVAASLKVLSFFFVGGAVTCSKLLSCQTVDGGGVPLEGYAFRPALPYLKCSDDDREEAGWVFCVGAGYAVTYCILIPSFLIFLIAKQHVKLKLNRRYVCWAEAAGDSATVRVACLEPLVDEDEKDTNKDQIASDHLLAAAIAYSAVFFYGPVCLTRDKDSAKLERLPGAGDDGPSLEIEAMSLLFWTTATKQNKTDLDLQRCQTITRMLSEREMLERESASDRIVAGAKTIFFKYAASQDVWVEAAMKGVAVALVGTVSLNSIMVTLFVTVGMAILLGAQKPYRQRQVNDLQGGCFVCLSLAAIGFFFGYLRLARCALVVPFIGAAVQMLRPDGPESLALRLHEAAKEEWQQLEPGKSMKISVETVRFV